MLREECGITHDWVCRDRRREARGDGGASASMRRLPQRPTRGHSRGSDSGRDAGRWRPHRAPSAVEVAPRDAAGCVATAAARLVATEAPAPACVASLNARNSATAGGATAAEMQPPATSHGVARRRNDPERRRKVRCDRRREARGDGGASASMRRPPQRTTLGRGWLELLEAGCLTCIDSECVATRS